MYSTIELIKIFRTLSPNGSLIGKSFTGNVVFSKPTTILHTVVVQKAGTFIFTVSGGLGGIIGIESGFITHIEEGMVAFRIDEDGCESVVVVPHVWEYEQDEDEVIIIGDDEEMQGRDRGN